MRSSRHGRWKRWRCGCRCRRSTNSTTAALSPAASNPAAWPPATRSSSCPPARSPEFAASRAGRLLRCREARAPADRSASRSTANCSSNAATSSPMSEARRATPAGFARGFSGCTTSRWWKAPPFWSGSARGKPAPPWSRSRRRSTPANSRASRPRRSRAIMSARSTFRWRSRSPPIPTPTIRAPGASSSRSTAALPAADWCCRSMQASAPFPSISSRWNPRCGPTSARRATVITAQWSG